MTKKEEELTRLLMIERGKNVELKGDAVRFVQWANKNGWYKHHDPHDDCWTNPESRRTLTTENLHKEYEIKNP